MCIRDARYTHQKILLKLLSQIGIRDCLDFGILEEWILFGF